MTPAMDSSIASSAFLLPSTFVQGSSHVHTRNGGNSSQCAIMPRMTATVRQPSVKPGVARRKSGTRTPTFRKLQQKQNEGPQAFREMKELERKKAAEAEALAVATAEAKREMKRARKARRRNATPLSDLKLGTEVTGVVQNLVRHGAYVDIGAKRDGLVHVRDMSIDFVHTPEDIVREGDTVTVWVKYVNPVSNVLGLSMRPHLAQNVAKEVTSIADLVVGQRYEGHVARITNFGAYVDIGAERHGFLHVNCLWGRRPRETLDELRLGRPIWVVVTDVDEIRSHIKLNARGKADIPLDALGKVVEEEEKEVTLSDPVTGSVVLARPGEEETEDEGELTDGEIGEILTRERSRDEHLVKNIGPVAQTSSWDEIRHLFDDSTEFVGMEEDSN